MILPLRLEAVSFLQVIKPLSLELEAGPSTIILGANGAGKSVLMRLMHGLLPPTAGTISWSSNGRQAMVFQRPVMLRRSALDNIIYALRVAGVADAERPAMDALKEVGLAELAHRPARVLSGGEQQRLALARAWSLRPRLLYLDEPTSSLDPGAASEVERIMGEIHAAGTAIVMTTHNLGLARRVADQVVFLHAGRVTEQTAADRFFHAPASPEAASFLKGELPWNGV
jgi:tungstate transport system ATP-binding protein